MASIGTLYGTLKLDSKGYERGMLQADRSTRRFGSRIEAVTSSRAFGRLAGLFTGVVIYNQVKGLINYGSALTDAAEQTRIGVEELQVLQDAARDAGVNVEILERALRNVTLRGEEAALGNESYARALRTLNIDLDAFNTLPTERKLEAIARAYVEGGKSAEDYAAVARILGEEAGPKLIEVLGRLGVEGFDALAVSAKASAAVLDEYSAQTLDRLADKLASLGASIKNIAATVVADVGGSVLALFGDELSNAQQLAQLTQQIADLEAFAATRAAQSGTAKIEVNERLNELYAEQARLLQELGQTGAGAAAAGEAVLEVPENLKVLLERAKSDVQKAVDANYEIGQLLDKYGELLTYEEKQRLENYARGLLIDAGALRGETDKLADAAQDLGLTFSSAFEDAIIGGEKFSDVLKGLGEDILRIFVRRTITEPLAGGLSNIFGSLFGGIFGGARASGGPVYSDRAYVVGEEGPELFVPGRTGVVMPNGAGFGEGGGATVVNQVINLSTGVAATVRAEVISMLPTIKKVTVSGVEEARVRRRAS